VYFARSSVGSGVAVGKGVLVGDAVTVAEGTSDAVAVAVGAGANDVQDERPNRSRNGIKINGVFLFRMG